MIYTRDFLRFQNLLNWMKFQWKALCWIDTSYKTRNMFLWWVDLQWLPHAQQATLLLPPQQDRGEENEIKINSQVKIKVIHHFYTVYICKICLETDEISIYCACIFNKYFKTLKLNCHYFLDLLMRKIYQKNYLSLQIFSFLCSGAHNCFLYICYAFIV